MKSHSWLFFIPTLLLLPVSSSGCLWDRDTLAQEKVKSPKLAEAILGTPVAAVKTNELRERIASLQAKRRESDPSWWNDLAGAHIRLGESTKAVTLLESVVKRFPNDYGIHANLGTAYHLLGRYADAEKFIARDLEINPDAHFGLEKYHLALLQYLTRNPKYQFRHVFVDEFSAPFLYLSPPLFGSPQEGLASAPPANSVNEIAKLERAFAGTNAMSSIKITHDRLQLLGEMSKLDPPPAYRKKWNLAANTNLQAGVIYLATLNPKQPACFTMLGVISQQSGDLNLAVAAYEKAIALRSPQANLLRYIVKGLKEHTGETQPNQPEKAKPVAKSSARKSAK